VTHLDSDFEFLEATVAQLHVEMASGRLTARSLTAAYLERIRALDPLVGSVIEVNPDALEIAASLDGEPARGALHGIPVLLKDNIATTDAMQTTAGSRALVGVRASREAHLVTRLRQAGAVILGKTNLSEWANIRSTRSTSGWSGRGGLSRNPYALDRNASGSSSGSAAAIAANFAAVAVGTETDGSIVSPASMCGLVGFKPTVGLVSRDGIIPISHTQDTAGPMTRCVADAAALLGALADQGGVAPVSQYTDFLDPGRLRGARLGVVRPASIGHPGVLAVFEQSLAALAAAGAQLVDPVSLAHDDDLGQAELEVLLYELKVDLADWLAEFAPGAPVKNLHDLIAWNEAHRTEEMPWFGQELFEAADARGPLTDQVYLDALAACRRGSRDEGIDAVLAEHRLDALVAPTGTPAWLTDLVNGDNEGASFATPAAVAGYPHITVPMGFVHGLPVGLSFVGPAWSEPLLIGLAYGFEQATLARRPPTFVPTLPLV